MRQDEEYKLKINNLRSIRLENRERFHSASAKMAKLIDSFKDNPFLTLEDLPVISYKELKTFEKGLWFEIDKEIYLRLEESTDLKLKFSAVLKPGAKFALKKHDSMQSILINEGRLLDLNNNTTYVKGDEVIYVEYEPHEHASDTYSEYTIYFHNPKE